MCINTTPSNADRAIMQRYNFRKSAVLPVHVRNVLLTAVFSRVLACVAQTWAARRIGDEFESVVAECAVLTARVFDPRRYRDPSTGRPFQLDEVVSGRLSDASRTELCRVLEIHAVRSARFQLVYEARKLARGGIIEAPRRCFKVHPLPEARLLGEARRVESAASTSRTACLNGEEGRAFLQAHYVVGGQSTNEIARTLGIVPAHVVKALRRHGLPVRSKSEARVLSHQRKQAAGAAR